MYMYIGMYAVKW